MLHTINFIKSQWLAVILVILFIIYAIFNTARIAEYKEKREKLNISLDSLELLAKKNRKLIDSLKKIDGVYVEKIKVIKQKEYEKIHIIDSLPANELQSYFSERYKE